MGSPAKLVAIAEALGPLNRIRARAETPGGVAQAATVSFSKAMEGKSFQKPCAVARKESGGRWKVEGGMREMEDGKRFHEGLSSIP
jgi:hypothetical protein